MEEKKKTEMTKEDRIGDALLKVALGYQVSEVTEEYAEVDGALKLTKRKKTKKDVPPDLKAVQMLLSTDGEGATFAAWTDEDLEKEKTRLLAELQTAEETKPKNTVKTAVAKEGAKPKRKVSRRKKVSTTKKK